MPAATFTKENARLMAKRSHAVGSARNRYKLAFAVRPQATQFELDSHSKEVKTRLSMDLLVQSGLLAKFPPKSISKLGNTPDGEGRASLVKRIAETASMVYGWDNEKGNSLVIVGLIGSLDPDNQVQAQESPAIDVESSPASPS